MDNPYPVLTPEERRRLIEAPITFHVYGSRSHGGCCTYDEKGEKVVAPNSRSSNVLRQNLIIDEDY